MRKMSNHKLICYNERYYLYSSGTHIYVSELGGAEVPLGDLPFSKLKTFLSGCRPLARGLRLEPRCGIFADEVTALVSFHGAIYRINCATGQIELEHIYRDGMNNPLTFVKLEGIKGFADGIYYGEYFLNHGGEAVRIMRRLTDGRWDQAYIFAPSQIYHIHGIVPGQHKDCLYILTGDKDSESGIYECHNDFAEVKPIVTGKQAYRACVALPVDGGMLYTTDTPLEENYLYHLDFSSGQIQPVMAIDGPSIYGRTISDYEFVFSTSVEPDSRITGLRYEFTRKLGPGVKNRKSHLYYCMWDGNQAHCKEVFAAHKDILPMGAGQFGTMMFPEGPVLEDKLLVTCQALRKYDNKTLDID